MIESLKNWWRDHSSGERALMGGLGAALLLVILWLGIWRPVTEGIAAGWERQSAALDRYESVRTKVAALRRTPGAGGQAQHVPMEQLVSQSATETGFMLDKVGNQGAGRMSISIASARMGPLLGWLDRLAANGVGVQTINIVPGTTDGTVAVQAVLQESGQ